MEPVTVITPTGLRPEALELCVSYMKRQTYEGKIQWIVIEDNAYEDGPVFNALPNNIRLDWMPGSKTWRPGINTQRPNLDAAIPRIENDYVFIFEDDDWYHPDYLKYYMEFFKKHPNLDIIGEGAAKYYNLPLQSYKHMNNYTHASLCQTGFKSRVLDSFEEAVNSGHIYIDIQFWAIAQKKKHGCMIFSEKNLAVGTKGLPGRMGIGVGHKDLGWVYDKGLLKLTSLIGKDVELYKEIFRFKKGEAA